MIDTDKLAALLAAARQAAYNSLSDGGDLSSWHDWPEQDQADFINMIECATAPFVAALAERDATIAAMTARLGEARGLIERGLWLKGDGADAARADAAKVGWHLLDYDVFMRGRG